MSKTNRNIFEIEIKAFKIGLNEIFKSFLVNYIDNEYFSIVSKLNIKQNLIQSESIIVQISEKNQKGNFFIICFKNTVIIINQCFLKTLQTTIFNYSKLPISFLSKEAQNQFREIIDIQDYLIKSYDDFNEEIQSIKDNIFDIKFKHSLNKAYLIEIIKMKDYITSCISGYLIRESYAKINNNQKFIYNQIIENGLNIKPSEKNNFKIPEYDLDYFIQLRTLGVGSSFKVILSYYIVKKELYAIKILNGTFDFKLIDHEIENYLKIDFPLLPKFYGKIKDSYSIVIQFINGKTLDKFEKNKLNDEDKTLIILELILIIEYLHGKHFVYRDLKPNNVIIDENKNIYVIDFDQMINIDDKSNFKNRITYFPSEYAAPEVNLGEITYKSDIYSLMKMFKYIIKNDSKEKEINNLYQQTIVEFIDNCIKECQCISEIKIEFMPYILFFAERYYSGEYITRDINKSIHYFSLAANQNVREAQYILGYIYYSGEYTTRDINKAIHYYSLASNQNHPNSQLILGLIYLSGIYTTRDINKAIYYFSLAANENLPSAQLHLGLMYLSGEYTTRDINKAINYFSLASNQNLREAQYILGLIYSTGIYTTRDINKAIHYFSLAANQNVREAQYILGFIYYSRKYITQDINKAIHYFILASNQNVREAQYILGLIYSSDEYNTRDINKSIHYFSLAANQNHQEAQFNLGLIYYSSEYTTRDINKAIHYFSLAANQNHPNSQFILGFIYFSGDYIQRDINKAIYYFSLASNQNLPSAQLHLGYIYYSGEYITRDINQAIHYFSLASNQNHRESQYNLGCIYYSGEYITRDINKAIHYFSLAANQNHPEAQFDLGFIYIKGIYIKKNMIKGIDLLIQSSLNKFKEAHFVVGYFYHEGKYVSRDIKKAIHYYKEGSSFNDEYAKNNLGIIYKNGIENEIQQNIGLAIAYFEEAINRFNNEASMYNLAHIYIYEDQTPERIDSAIKLLFKSLNNNFLNSILLLCIALIKKYGYNFQLIKKKLQNQTKKIIIDLSNAIYEMIQEYLNNEENFKLLYQYYKKVDYLYDFNYKAIRSNSINEPIIIQTKSKTGKDITSDFYEGFKI